MTRSATRCITLALAVCAIAWPAYAIDCERGYQRIRGDLLATPYCQDEYLAVVAREYGVNASGARIRNNPNYKKEVCRLIFSDNRVRGACATVGVPEYRGGR